jgi:hypothetical protein
MNNDIQSQPEMNSSESNATTATEIAQPQIQDRADEKPPLPNAAIRRPKASFSTKTRIGPEPPIPAKQPTVPPKGRMSHKEHMEWLRDISTQIRDHYEEKTGNKMPKPVSNQLFNRDMGVWFSSRQKAQAESADLIAVDPVPFDPTAVEGQEAASS